MVADLVCADQSEIAIAIKFQLALHFPDKDFVVTSAAKGEVQSVSTLFASLANSRAAQVLVWRFGTKTPGPYHLFVEQPE